MSEKIYTELEIESVITFLESEANRYGSAVNRVRYEQGLSQLPNAYMASGPWVTIMVIRQLQREAAELKKQLETITTDKTSWHAQTTYVQSAMLNSFTENAADNASSQEPEALNESLLGKPIVEKKLPRHKNRKKKEIENDSSDI